MKVITLILFCSIVGSSKAQIGLSDKSATLPKLKTDYLNFYQPQFFGNLFDVKIQKPVFYLLPNSTTYIPPAFIPIKIDHAPGIFCKIESKLESKSKLLPRFRLGSLAYTEWMEGKRIWLQ